MLKLTRKETESAIRTLNWVLDATQADDLQRKTIESIRDKLIISLKTVSGNIEFETINETNSR